MKKPAINGYSIFRQEELSETFIRVIIEQLDQCLELNMKFAKHPDFSTHEIRKSTKRIRAVYKLFRQATGDDRYVHAKQVHGKVSIMLAEHRINAVNIETMHYVAADKRMSLNPELIARLVSEMTERHQRFTGKLMGEAGIQSNIKEILLSERQQLLAEPLMPTGFKELAMGLRNTYKQGSKSLEAITRLTDTESLHNLRKQVKSLWNQLILLRPVWPVMVNSYIRQYDQLAEKLGMDHDLAELGQYFIKEPAVAASGEIANLLHAIERKRSQVQKCIFPLAYRLYAEKPGAFSTKIGRYYREYVR